ncbi:hypothetical protein TNCV_3237341 [Trichonephila clavipes]|nr:hypothetical protein TNCV_3237341 [Trichonephila clavipes]
MQKAGQHLLKLALSGVFRRTEISTFEELITLSPFAISPSTSLQPPPPQSLLYFSPVVLKKVEKHGRKKRAMLEKIVSLSPAFES